MIHEIAMEVAAALKAAGCPVPVIADTEPHTTTTWGRERIVIERDEGSKDSFVPPRSQSLNPKRVKLRRIAAKATIYAQSTAAGARPFEHKRRLDAILDQVIIALVDCAQLRQNKVEFPSGNFFTPPDLIATQVAAGAAYELSFTFERSVDRRTFVGDAQPVNALGGVTSTTKVSRAGGPDDGDTDVPASAETACGA